MSCSFSFTRLAKVQHLNSIARLGEHKPSHPSLGGVQGSIDLMQRDLKIVKRIRNAFILLPGNYIPGTLSYNNICTRMN